MKNILITMAMAMTLGGWHNRAVAQQEEIAQLLLNVEKLAQFKGILSDMKKGYEILNGGYRTIKELSEGNFSLHKTFLDGLLEVSPTVREYRKVPLIINNQVLLVKEYRKALSRFSRSELFSGSELDYMERVYGNLLKLSLRNLDELLMVVTAGQMRMSDDERLKAIDRICDEMEDKLQFLRHFNNSTSILELQRSKERSDIQQSRVLHGLSHP